MSEAMLEPLLRRMRMRRVLPILARHPDCRLLDVGCGATAALLHAVEPYVAAAVGVDRKPPPLAAGKLSTIAATLDDALPFPDRSFDVVTMLAVLEHLDRPAAIVAEVHRVLKPGGQAVLTVPSRASKPLLEFLAFRVGVVSRDEILDHKRYYDRDALRALFEAARFRVDRHRYFQLGMNNFLVATRTAA